MLLFKRTARIKRSWDCLIEVLSYVPMIISVWEDQWTYAYLSLKKLHRSIQVETKVCVDHFSYIRNCNYLRVWQLNVGGLQQHVNRCGYFRADWSLMWPIIQLMSSCDKAWHVLTDYDNRLATHLILCLLTALTSTSTQRRWWNWCRGWCLLLFPDFWWTSGLWWSNIFL